MEPTARKLVTIVTESVIEKELLADLKRLRVTGYTVTDARGQGARGIRDAGWEHGANIRIEVVCDSATADAIATHLRENYYRDYAMILFTMDVAVLRPEKF